MAKRLNIIPREEFDAKIDRASEVDWVRLATLIDAEGSIMIAKSKPMAKFRQKSSQYGLRVSISNTGFVIMDWLLETFSNHHYDCDMKHNLLGKKQCMAWVVLEDRAAVILRGCLPYMLEKKQQAKAALAFRRIKSMGAVQRKEVSALQLQLRERYHRKVKALNGSWERGEEKNTASKTIN